jgi:hypothetical protein
MPSFQNSRLAMVLASGMFGDAETKDAGLDQPADIAQRAPPSPPVVPVIAEPSGRFTLPCPSIAMPPIVLVMRAQIRIAKNGGVSIRRGAALCVERSGNSVTSP